MSDSPPAATVTVRFSKATSPTSGDIVISAGAPGAVPGPQSKSTLLSLKPSAETGAAYHQLRSNASQPGCTSGRLEVAAVADEVAVDLADAARAESFGQLAQAGERSRVSQAPSRSVSVAKQRLPKVGSPRP